MRGIKIIILTGCFFMASGIFSCHDEEKSYPTIEKIQFAESKKEMTVGERATVKLTITPQSARENNKVEYSASAQGKVLIDSKHSSNEGVVFEAIGSGSVVIMAKVNGLVDYCNVIIDSDNEVSIPYISVTDSIVEMKVGTKRHVVASLQGGIPSDQNNFVFVNNNSDTVTMDYANNTAVIEGIKTGSARITAIHPKSKYSVDVLAFVLNEGETAKYITGENVVFTELGSQPREYKARLVGLKENEVNYCIYHVIEGTDIITVKGSGDSCTIEAKKAGVAKVRVINQAVVYPFEFQVVVRDTAETKYINSPGNLFIIDNSDFRSINVSMTGDVPDDFIDYYTYKLSVDGIIDVLQMRGNFVIKGLKNGTALMTISNKYSSFDCEILIVVQNQEANAHPLEVYIRTSQQLIQMEIGGPDAILKMELVGGNEADRNNFEWEVEDSRIINAVAPGDVRYARSITRQTVETEAVITAKKTGVTKIRVFNQKALNEVTVMVKVYPKGTFNGQAIYIGGPGIIKVQEGQSVSVYTPVVGGDERLLDATVWESADSAIAEIYGSGLYGNVTGIKSGITRLKVSGNNIVQDYEAVIAVYREGENELIPYAYTDSVHYRITVGQTVKIPIHHPNIADSQFLFSVINNNKNSVYHVVSHDIIIVNGLNEGSGELVITTSDVNCNNITVYITVESEQADANRPYMLTGNNFAGTNEGGIVSYTVALAGANAGKLNGILWSIDDERVARIKGRSGNMVEIEGLAKGQTTLRINHSESMNEKAVVVYVVEKGAPIDGKIVIGIEKTNYVMTVNQSLFLRLVTNATESQKLGFVWKSNYADKVYIEDNYDTAIITARETGNVKVTVYEKDSKHVIDLDIFITILEERSIKGDLGFPDSVILIKNRNKIIKGNVIGVTPDSVDDISYTPEDQGIVSVMGQGMEVILKGLEQGQTFLTVTSFKMDYYRKILVICVENESDLDNLFYFTVDKTLYRIKKNDEININLLFGENGFPESEKTLIEWHNTSNNQAVLIASQGGGASVIGKNEGQAVIQIKSRLMAKPVEIVIEVSDIVKGSDYYRFVYTPIHQTTKNSVNMIPISIYYGNEYYDEHDVYKPGIKMDQGYGGITVEVNDKSIADAAMAGQSLRIAAKSPGRTEITLSHEMIAEDAKLLIVVYDGEPPADEFVVFIPKTHWLIAQGQTKTITLRTNSGSPSFDSGIIWNNHNQDLYSVNASDKANALVTANKEGSGTITVEYQGKIIDTVYISVASIDRASTVSVATESIIVLSIEDADLDGYTTRIIVNGGNEYGIVWNIADRTIAEFQDNGTMCRLWPLNIGITELTVRGNGFNKTIIVKVVNTETEKLSARLMNLDQRYYKVRKGETYILNPYYKVIKPFCPVSVSQVYDNRVIQCRQTSGGITVTGKNIGIERLKLFNGECENDVEIVFEVDETISGVFTDVKNMVYMTTDTPAVIIEPGQVDYYVGINVIGEYKGGENDFKWSVNSNKITVKSFGRYALISAGNQKGDTEITVSNIFCDGLPLKIKIIIGDTVTYNENNVPYIYTAKNVYTMKLGDPELLIPLEIRGLNQVNYSNVMITTSGDAVHCGFSNGNIVVNEMYTGTAGIRVKYQGIEQTLDLYVIVQGKNDSGMAYLTTGQNYIIVNRHNTYVLDVNLVNYTEPDSSKFSWTSANDSIAHVIGNGRTVQILGMDTGVTKVTVSHPQAYNDLDIIVKINPAGSNGNICYLTTGDNVIETYVSTTAGQIIVNKVGGITGAIEAAWSVDDPTVVSVIGNNNIGYYTAKKAGTAKITVTDREAGSVSIVVIVRKTRPGDMYLSTPESIVQITPNSGNNTIGVTLSGGDESDEKDFKWEIYTQLPGNIDVARQGGSVISLFAMGSRASVNGIYAGTARIKVTHPKAPESLFILVQVTNFKSMRFTQPSIDLETEDMMYVTLETPDYENYTGKIKYMTDNPSVCTVYGSSKAVLVSAHMPGKAIVTAYVEGTDLTATVNINVAPEKNYEQPYIITPKTTYVLNPRELPFLISAQLFGVGVTEQDWDSLVWTVKNNDANIIKIYPENIVEGGIVQANKSIGRMIQVLVQNRQYDQTESCTIEISCPRETSRIKTIFLQVQEDSNAFTLNKYDMKMQSGDMMELSCNILGGGSKDYDDVYWMADTDDFDPTKDIVKIMGRGKFVQLLAIADGVTQVTAVYRGLTKCCAVTVKSSNYFNIQYRNYLTYPGERQNNNNLIEIQYEVRPVNAFIQWLDSDNDFNNKIANISYSQAEDDGTGTGIGKIYLDPIQEGTFYIMGISNNKNAKVSIVVKNIYRFILDSHDVFDTPFDWPINYFGTIKAKSDTTLNYIISPGNVKIAVKYPTEQQLYDMGITLEISEAKRNDEALKGIGTIYVKCVKETPGTIPVLLETLRTDGKPSGNEQILNITAQYPKGEGRLVPVFEKVYGEYSNPQASYPIASKIGKRDELPLTGQLYETGRYLETRASVPVIPGSSSQSNGTYTDTYFLEIGDGEEHYILLDKINPNAYINIEPMVSNINNKETLGGKNRTITAQQVVRENGETAIRVTGGNDYVVYSKLALNYNYKINFQVINESITQIKNKESSAISRQINSFADLDSLAFTDSSDSNRYILEYVENTTGSEKTSSIIYYSWSASAKDWPTSYSSVGQQIALKDRFSGKTIYYIIPENNYDNYTIKTGSSLSLAKASEYDIHINNGVTTLRGNVVSLISGLKKWETYNQYNNSGMSTWNPLLNSWENGHLATFNLSISSGDNNSMAQVLSIYANGHRLYGVTNSTLINKQDAVCTLFSYRDDSPNAGYLLRDIINMKAKKWTRDVNPALVEPSLENWDGNILFAEFEGMYTTDYTNVWQGSYSNHGSKHREPDYPKKDSGKGSYIRFTNGYFEKRKDTNYTDTNVININKLYNFPFGASVNIANIGVRKVSIIKYDHKFNGEYIFKPMPSIKTATVLDDVSMGSITIPYKNSYNGVNYIIINLTQKIRQCHANYIAGGVQYPLAENWEKVDQKPIDEIFTVGNAKIIPKEQDESKNIDDKNKIFITKDY